MKRIRITGLPNAVSSANFDAQNPSVREVTDKLSCEISNAHPGVLAATKLEAVGIHENGFSYNPTGWWMVKYTS